MPANQEQNSTFIHSHSSRDAAKRFGELYLGVCIAFGSISLLFRLEKEQILLFGWWPGGPIIGEGPLSSGIP